MARSFFTLVAGVKPPKDFQLKYPPQLLTQQDLWDASRQCPPSLLFRVRSTEGTPGGTFGAGDKLESCVGLVDAATRWRSVFKMVSTALAGIHDSALAAACNKAVVFLTTQHPAAVGQQVRRQIGEEIMKAATTDTVNGAEQRIAAGLAALAQCDNDIEAAFVLPFAAAFMPYSKEEQPEEFRAREATIETISGAVLITEAASRLAERMPVWMFVQMPQVQLEAPSSRGGVRSDAHDAEDDDGPDGL